VGHGIEFEQPLVSDGGGGLCTRRRVSPQLLTGVGLPSLEDAEAVQEWRENPSISFEELRERLGLDATEGFAQPANPDPFEGEMGKSATAQAVPTFKELAERYVAHIRSRGRINEIQLRYIDDHLLPAFGNRQINQVNGGDIDQWLVAKTRHEGFTPAAALRISSMVSYMFKLARRWDMPGAEPNPIPRADKVRWRVDQRRVIAAANLERLHEAASASANPQLRHVVTLLLETGVDTRDLLAAKWAEMDLEKGLWRIPLSIPGAFRELSLSEVARETIEKLPRWMDCPYLIANPRTRRPYKSLAQSWNSVRQKAGLTALNLDDLRYLSLHNGQSV
jgi:integrase